MSQIDTKYVGELFQNQKNLMSSSQFMIADTSFRMPPLNFYDTSQQNDSSNSNIEISYQPQNIYQTQFQNIEIKDTENNWNAPLELTKTCDPPTLISWTPVIQQPNFFPQQMEEKKFFYVGNSVDNPINNYAVYPGVQNYWNDVPEFKDESNSFISDLTFLRPSDNQYGNPCVINQNILEDRKTPNNYQFPKRWLLTNFERVDEDCTIARSTMYGYYVYACHERGEKPMNSAGLGKVIGSVFGRMKNRRLGARGDSRYHYIGIKVKENSPISSIPVYTANHYAALHSKTKKSKTEENEASSESPDSCETINDIAKQRTDLQFLESLEQKPLSYFTTELNTVTKFNITIQVVNSSKFVEDENSYQNYLQVFDQLYVLFSEVGSQIIESFKELNSSKLYFTVKNFWLRDHQITENSTLKDYTSDSIIAKFIYHYDNKFYQLLIEKCIGNLFDDISEQYTNKIIFLFTSIHSAIQDSQINQNILAEKMKSLEIWNKFLVSYREIQVLKRTKLQKLTTKPGPSIKLNNLCIDKNFSIILEDFHKRNSFSFSKFVIDIKFYDEFYIKLATIAISHSSKDWLMFMKNQFIVVQNNYYNSNICLIFVQEWCVYQNLMQEYLIECKNIDPSDSLLLNSLALKYLIFMAENNKMFENLSNSTKETNVD